MPSADDTSAVGGLFLRDGDNVAELAVQDFASEDELQALIADHPEMLAGAQIDPEEPRRFLLIRREAPVAGMSLDHLFVDQDAVPTLVEVKRSTDTRSRREVVAQMLDYAANAAGEWNERLLREWLVDRTGQDDAASALLAELAAPTAANPDRFWEQVDQNLRDGKVRLIFVADAIPAGLRRIVEFLNERMVPTEVLAIEVRQYLSGAQQLLQTRLVGQTVAAREVKGTARRAPVMGVLADADLLHDGDDIWFVPSIIPVAHRPAADDPRLKAKLVNQDGRWVIEYQPDHQAAAMVLAPASAWNAARAAIEPGYQGDRMRAVHDCFSLEPGGATLGELAEQHDLW